MTEIKNNIKEQALDLDMDITEFAFQLTGTINKQFISIETDSKKALLKIITLMDDGE